MKNLFTFALPQSLSCYSFIEFVVYIYAISMFTYINCVELCIDGSVRITGTNLDYIGSVQVCINSTWGTICEEEWDDADASVVCNQLGFSSYGKFELEI